MQNTTEQKQKPTDETHMLVCIDEKVEENDIFIAYEGIGLNLRT